MYFNVTQQASFSSTHADLNIFPLALAYPLTASHLVGEHTQAHWEEADW